MYLRDGYRHGHTYCKYDVLVVLFMRWQSSARALAVVAIVWRAVLGAMGLDFYPQV